LGCGDEEGGNGGFAAADCADFSKFGFELVGFVKRFKLVGCWLLLE